MHFGMDIREACDVARTGKGQWALGFLREFVTRDHELTLFTNADPPNDLAAAFAGKPDVHVVKSLARGFSWHCTVARILLEESSIDCYISPTSYLVPFLLGSRKKVLPIVHDLVAFRSEPHARRAQLIERLCLPRTVRYAAHIFTVSDATKRDLLDRYPHIHDSHVTTIFAGPTSHPPVRHGQTKQMVLSIGTLCPRKNQLRLIQAFASLPKILRDETELILVGKRGWDDDDIVRLASATPGVSWREYLPDEECRTLMQRATVYAFPSLYEGFGMSVLDAMRNGVPVLTSDRGSLRELVGATALLINPENVQSIACGLESLLTNSSDRAGLAEDAKKRSEQFAWQRTVDLFLAAMETIV